MSRQIVIDPITRLEGHGKIDIFVDEAGHAERAVFQVPELRGFEKFAQGRPAEDMPQITSRICGVCPMAHHMAATKALDALYQAEPPPAARKIRELAYNAFMAEDHALHFYFLGGPDFIVGPQAPAAQRNVLGVIARVGEEAGRQVIAARKRLRGIMAAIGGKVIHPVMGLPGGVAKPVTHDQQQEFRAAAEEAVEFARFTLAAFQKLVLGNAEYVDLIRSDTFTHRTYYLGQVDEEGRPNFYDGKLRVIDPAGAEWATFEAARYAEYIGEHVEPWTMVKLCYLKPVGWNGFEEGAQSGIYAVAPLARLNVATAMATPEAEAARQQFYSVLGPGPVHHTLATHWARVIELLQAAERIRELASDPELTDPNVRRLPTATPGEGVGVVEAPRGTLIHHYATDEKGLIRKANLIVATQNNGARISMSVDKAARGLITNGQVTEGLQNMVEMAFRAYDPCFGCATHALPAAMPVEIRVRRVKET
jgi:F420-non-reducing hydrogenase large subunit